MKNKDIAKSHAKGILESYDSTATGGESTETVTTEGNKPTWDIQKAEVDLVAAYEKDSELDVLKVLKENSFLFYDLYSRKGGIQPVFRKLNFGGDFRCDFAWLNDNSSGPEWVIVEIEKPKMALFKANGEPTRPLTLPFNKLKNGTSILCRIAGSKKNIWCSSKIQVYSGDRNT